MYITYFESWNLAVILLTFIAGLALSFIIKSRGVSGCFTYIISIVILLIIISGLVKGYSIFIENVTFHLQQYIYYNTTGILGFIGGFIVGFLIRRGR